MTTFKDGAELLPTYIVYERGGYPRLQARQLLQQPVPGGRVPAEGGHGPGHVQARRHPAHHGRHVRLLAQHRPGTGRPQRRHRPQLEADEQSNTRSLQLLGNRFVTGR